MSRILDLSETRRNLSPRFGLPADAVRTGKGSNPRRSRCRSCRLVPRTAGVRTYLRPVTSWKLAADHQHVVLGTVRQHHWPSRRCRRLALRLRGAPEGRDPEDLLVGLAGARQGLHSPGRPRLGRRSDYLAELTNVPELAAESFAGVANPFSLGRLAAAERVLDLGSGAGTDSLVAAEMGIAQRRVRRGGRGAAPVSRRELRRHDLERRH